MVAIKCMQDQVQYIAEVAAKLLASYPEEARYQARACQPD